MYLKEMRVVMTPTSKARPRRPPRPPAPAPSPPRLKDLASSTLVIAMSLGTCSQDRCRPTGRGNSARRSGTAQTWGNTTTRSGVGRRHSAGMEG